MADKKDPNAYHVKIQLIPNRTGYKPSFVQGIVLANDQETAVKTALDKFKDAAVKDGFEHAETKVASAVKLRKDFLFISVENGN
jgi:hypothetical protein